MEGIQPETVQHSGEQRGSMPAKWNHVTAGEIARATGATLVNGEDRTIFNGLSTDSRSIENGYLFVALTGDRFDGHDFVPDTMGKGASGAIITRNFFQTVGKEHFRSIQMKSPNPAILTVDDTLNGPRRSRGVVAPATPCQGGGHNGKFRKDHGQGVDGLSP